MNQFLYELLWFFFTYAFAGWVIGTALPRSGRKSLWMWAFCTDRSARLMVWAGWLSRSF